MSLNKKTLTQKSYTINKANFAIVILDIDNETFVIYIVI